MARETASQLTEIDAGTLDRRATLLQPVYNQFEDEITGWNPVATVWAGVLPNTAREINESGHTVMVTQSPIVIRYRSDIDARWRIQVDGQTWEILGIVNVANRRAQMQVQCQLVQ